MKLCNIHILDPFYVFKHLEMLAKYNLYPRSLVFLTCIDKKIKVGKTRIEAINELQEEVL